MGACIVVGTPAAAERTLLWCFRLGRREQRSRFAVCATDRRQSAMSEVRVSVLELHLRSI